MTKTSLFTIIIVSILSKNLSAQTSDLGKIKTENGNPPVYLAIGSSLSAGVRNDGIYKESQLTSFPNLLAQQMGVRDFKQPLIETALTGTKKTITLNGILRFAPDMQQLLDDSKPEVKLPKTSTELNNWSVPYLKVMNIDVKANEPSAFLPAFDLKQYQHLNRLLDGKDEGETSYIELLNKQIKKVDFFTYEIGMYDFVSYYTNGGFGQQISFLTQAREGYYPENKVLDLLLSKGAKGVIANIPDIMKFPLFHYYTFENLESKVGNIFIERLGKNSVRLAEQRDIFLPSESISNLIDDKAIKSKGLSPDQPIEDNEVLGWEEQINVDYYNRTLSMLANQHKLPIVDLYSLYEKILKGNYVTEDGVKVNPLFPNGNFFSADGINPTALGQAIIANEFIKTINSFYNSKIPLVNTTNIK
ncbi:SGNH/GDSL hydrolase family protein [Emticicia fontis]